MKRTLWLLATAIALAGCSGDDGEGVDHAHCQPSEYEDEQGVCQPHVEPSIIVSGLPESVAQFQKVEFSWRLDPGTRGMDEPLHSMDNRILVSTSSDPVTNATGPEEWGEEVARQQHKNLPDNFTASFAWDDIATLYVKGYMQINNENIWTDLGTLDVTQAVATGVIHTVTITGPPPSLEDGEVSIKVGDAVEFENSDPAVAYTVSFDCGPSDVQVAAGETSDPVVFLEPGQCRYTVNSPMAATENDPLAMDGTIQVAKP